MKSSLSPFSADPIVQVRNLTKRFGDFTAVDGVSFDIRQGEILGLLGPNGAGKTTTIQMLLGLITPTAGEIRMFGLPFDRHREEILGRVNFSSTYVSMPQALTVEENLRVVGKLYGMDRITSRIDDIVKRLEMEEFRSKITRKLSSGQMTRLSLAKAFLTSPKVLFLDEPTASLDPDIADKTRALIKEVRRSTGLTVLYTSHNMREMEEMSDRIIFLQRGRIVAEGTAEAIKAVYGETDLEDVFLKLARTAPRALGLHETPSYRRAAEPPPVPLQAELPAGPGDRLLAIRGPPHLGLHYALPRAVQGGAAELRPVFPGSTDPVGRPVPRPAGDHDLLPGRDLVAQPDESLRQPADHGRVPGRYHDPEREQGPGGVLRDGAGRTGVLLVQYLRAGRVAHTLHPQPRYRGLVHRRPDDRPDHAVRPGGGGPGVGHGLSLPADLLRLLSAERPAGLAPGDRAAQSGHARFRGHARGHHRRGLSRARAGLGHRAERPQPHRAGCLVSHDVRGVQGQGPTGAGGRMTTSLAP